MHTSATFLDQLHTGGLVADGAMGTMLQGFDLSLDDFRGLEGCNEILSVTRPDVVEAVHAEYLNVGVNCVETNTFGANLSNLGEYGIEERIYELARAGAAAARKAADEAGPGRFVLGSMGPGTKLPTLGHVRFDQLEAAFYEQARGLLDAGADALLVETVQDVLQAKAAIVGAQRAVSAAGVPAAVLASVTVETTGTMLLGTEIGAALTALEALGIDGIGLNCATGPAEMVEHIRYLTTHARVPITVMPNAGLPELRDGSVYYPLDPVGLAAALKRFVTDFGVSLVGGCCGTTPAHLGQVVQMMRDASAKTRVPQPEPAVSSLYQSVSLVQDADVLAIGERTNANGSKAFREALLSGDIEACVDIAKGQTRDGAHVLDVCVDYVGRDGVKDITEIVSALATGCTLPLVIDSTEPDVIAAGLAACPGRAVVNSVNYEDGDGPTSRFVRIMESVKRHGAAVVALTIDEEGQARTAEHKVAIAERLIADLTQNWGMQLGDIVVDCLTFPIATGQEETRRDGIETLTAIEQLNSKYPGIGTTLGVSNVSFGLNPAARRVLNSVFLHEARKRGLTSAIIHAARIVPVARIPEEHLQVALDLIYDRRRYAEDGQLEYDPLQRMLELFEGVDAAADRDTRAAELAALPLNERLQRRIIDGEKVGLAEDLDAALAEGTAPLAIINDTLLAGMKVVGDRFGAGEMQLPFVLQSAETMKAAVAHLEPHIQASGEGGSSQGKAKIVLATVKGDVHDIGKNLVDIILSNNGFDVVNIGIKQPIGDILQAAEQHNADAIGMSGLLVKSTVIMQDNLAEMNSRAVAERFPVLLGGAALTRAFVEDDLAELYDGHVRYAKDAFEGLALMEAIAAAKRANDPVAQYLPALRQRRVPKGSHAIPAANAPKGRSDVERGLPVLTPPFWGSQIVKGIALAEYLNYLDERATFMGQWGLKPGRGEGGLSYDDLVETQGRPRLRMWLDRIHTESILQASVVYGYFPCWSEGDDVVIAELESVDGQLQPTNPLREQYRVTFPRQTRDRGLCVADFFADKAEVAERGAPDVIAFTLATMGSKVSDVASELFAHNEYRDYMELHGLSVQLTEALAEMWHARVRSELGYPDDPSLTLPQVLKQGYRGSRYSFGYPACPSLEDRKISVALLEPERVGVILSEELQLHPEQSTDAFVVMHPEAKYFSAG